MRPPYNNMRRIKSMHFVGIGGTGMCGIAEVLLNQGYHISGSDNMENAAVQRLCSLGVDVYIGHHEDNVKDADAVVISSAILPDNPEVTAAHQRRIPVLPRAQMLAELMRFRHGIAISGTHGKTTTTSLIASILAEGGVDPTFVIGGLLNSVGTNARLGASQYFVAEADESDASFLRLNPIIAVVTNIDADHMRTYNNDFNQLKQAFVDFLHNLPFYGLAVICNEDPAAKSIISSISRPVITYGFSSDADIWVEKFEQLALVCKYRVHFKNRKTSLKVVLNLPGRHNILNSLAAIAVAVECQIDDAAILRALKNFKGVGRRLQFYGELQLSCGKVAVLDDYGHHPSEIKVSLEAVRRAWPDRRLVLAFQPHRYTRTQALFGNFVEVLSSADALLLLDVYAAGEMPIPGVDSESLALNIRNRGKADTVCVKNADDLIIKFGEVLRGGDVLLLQGAGNIGSVAPKLALKFDLKKKKNCK